MHHKVIEVRAVYIHHVNRQNVVCVAASIGRNVEVSSYWLVNVLSVLWMKNLYLFGPLAWEEIKEVREVHKLFAICNTNFLCNAEMI